MSEKNIIWWLIPLRRVLKRHRLVTCVFPLSSRLSPHLDYYLGWFTALLLLTVKVLGSLLLVCLFFVSMMMSSNGNIFRITDPLWGESTSHQWIPFTKASDPELRCFFICAWTKVWANHGGTSDLRSHCAHCDITWWGYGMWYKEQLVDVFRSLSAYRILRGNIMWMA